MCALKEDAYGKQKFMLGTLWHEKLLLCSDPEAGSKSVVTTVSRCSFWLAYVLVPSLCRCWLSRSKQYMCIQVHQA